MRKPLSSGQEWFLRPYFPLIRGFLLRSGLRFSFKLMIIIDQNFSFSLQKRASTKYCGGTTILFSRHHWNSIMLIVNSNGDTSLGEKHSNTHLSWSSLTITCLVLPDNGLAPLLDVAQDHPGQAPPLLTSRAWRSRTGKQASTLLCHRCRVSPSPQTLLRPILPLTTLPLPVHHGLGDAEDIVGGVAAHGLEEGGGVAPLEKVRSRAGSPCPTSTIASILHPPTPALRDSLNSRRHLSLFLSHFSSNSCLGRCTHRSTTTTLTSQSRAVIPWHLVLKENQQYFLTPHFVIVD